MLTWGDWMDHPLGYETPYVDWFDILHEGRRGDKPEFVRQIVPRAADDFKSLDTGGDALAGAETAEPGPFVIRSPKFMTNTGFSDWWNNRSDKQTWLPPADTFDYPTVDDDAVIIGIIDVGLALGHRRFRLADGRTRVLGTWLQGAPVDGQGDVPEAAPHLPFGGHLFEAQINETLTKASIGQDLKAPLDQDGFNRMAGLTNFSRPETERLLAGRASHGTHVMGLAGGADPDTAQGRVFAEKTRFLLVSLPPALAFGEGGTFLDFYLIYALRWLVEANARIAEKSGLDKPRPMVVNASFGKHAGSKDGAQPFVNAMLHQGQSGRSAAQGVDEVTTRVPFHAVLPAGNSNLDRATAKFLLTPLESPQAEIDWVVQPDDETSNFLEIWCEETSDSEAGDCPLAIELVPPGQAPVGEGAGADGQIQELFRTVATESVQQLARIYCQRIDPPSAETGDVDAVRRFRYLLCLGPDRYRSDIWDNPPSGRWTVRLKNLSPDKPLSVSAMVQTDLPVMPGSSVTRAAYLDDPTYEKFTEDGRVRDTHDYRFRRLFQSESEAADLDTGEFVKRHGTLNTYAANSTVATIAGYRANDGRPAAYSSTGRGIKAGPDARGAPTIALPTDDGYAHPGVLSDGASDGSVVAMQGTSFASAMATRMVVNAWLSRQHDPYGNIPINQFLAVTAQRQPAQEGWFKSPVEVTKVGAGRVVFDDRRSR
ncbi:S8 family serine peptidase [Tropicibacter sp. R16_0]|uniref:S8 family serine peptidase n=1 Tax=Tropicibacter sp. R16_0 TaxID=2821102 RepID=UPI001ADBC566|nr:S8 family serine peptidase [Tropicibacter sp. R16_0]MBO9451948.1 S8 family serine peptidase [Tropicibacter sp. R16_0]